MARKPAVANNQLSFDFDSNEEAFTNTLETINRIQSAADTDTPDLFEGINYVDRTIEAVGIRSEGSQPRDTENDNSDSLQSVRVENSGPLGLQHPRQTSEARNARGDDVVEPLIGATESGASSTGAGHPGDGGTRSAGNESHPNRAGITPVNYVITDHDQLGKGGAKSKYRDNIAALKLIQSLKSEGRNATPLEQEVLVRYVGWGGIPQAFDHKNTEWHKEFLELSELLPKEEYEAARRSTQDAHYTSRQIIEAIYAGLERLGLDGGRLLDPSLGTGHFIGLVPSSIRDKSKFTGIELDPSTAEIAKQLYPGAVVINKGYQDVAIPTGYFDAVIGNPPFGNQTLFDPNHRDLSAFSIHNYFIAKSLDKVRNGGIVAVVVSSFFLDANNSATRDWIADRAHLLGAIRLPNTAFKENALTEVTTDIVFFQKANLAEVPDRSWTAVGSVKDIDTDKDIPLNNYYVQNPQMILGRMTLAGRMYEHGIPTCIEVPEIDLTERLMTALATLPQHVYYPALPDAVRSGSDAVIDVPDSVKIGAFFIADNRVARRLPDLLNNKNFEWVETKNARALERIKGMIEIRTALRLLMTAERSSDVSNTEVAALRENLNRQYDLFQSKYGYISALSNKQAMGDDPDYPLLHSLERDYDRGVSKEIAKRDNIDTRAPYAKKAAIFHKRVTSPNREITTANSAKDAMLVSLNDCGRIDMPLMMRLTGLKEEAIIKDLAGLIYRNPTSNAWESADKYLTGNVKIKLKQATEAVRNDPSFGINVDALRLVQPADIDPIDIGVQLGSTWVPAKVMDDFINHLFGKVYRSVSYQPSIGKWLATIGSGDPTTMQITWGTAEAPANKLLETILANKPITVQEPAGKDDNGSTIYRVNEEKTAIANQKADELKQAFLDWIWEDQTRRDELARLYNDTFNTNVEPKYNGAHLTLPGASMDIELRRHQKDAIWRGIQDGAGLFDHTVGAGKTYVMIGVAMESRRMGLLKKPMIVVPNHLLLQWKDAFYSLYPNANVLVAEKSDFTKENRQKLFAKVATGDWDAVIVGQSSMKKIGMPQQMLDRILSEQVDDLTHAVRRLKDENGDRVTIKNLEKMRERMTTKLERAADTRTKDNVVTFDELGVDAILYDESQHAKNLFINTSLSRVAGLGNLSGSDLAFDLFVKGRYLQTKYDGRGLFFGTGTPISNTIAEMYTIQRYMQYDELKARNIEHFDAWASTFGKVETGWELDATGTNYKLNSRFAKFQNVPELIAMYRTFADVIGRSDLDRQAAEEGRRFPVPKIKGGKPLNIIVDRSPDQAEYMGTQLPVLDDDGRQKIRVDGSLVKDWNKGSIIYRMENLPKDPRVDNPLKITNDARKAGLDYRLINPEATDYEGSKVNEAVRNVVRIWEKWEERKGTQLIFCDLSTPKAMGNGSVPSSSALLKTSDNHEKENDDSEVVISMDELLASSNPFSVYQDIKAKLIDNGIPENEIRFIHDANTDVQKAKLFSLVNSGLVRVLIGSTAKMGAGTNVQRKLVAEHHIDAPWRPSDLEQREGRILRQGNEFYEQDPDGFEVELIRYATKQTYDARMWQTIEYKAAGIEQFRKGDSTQRTIEDIAGEAANAAEMKAAATGNPLIFMQVKIAAELKKAEAAYANYKRNRHTIESKLRWLEGSEMRAKKSLTAIQKNIERRDKATTQPWRFIVGQHSYTAESKDDLSKIVLNAMQGAIKTQAKTKFDKAVPLKVGVYRGFNIDVHCTDGVLQFSVTGEIQHTPSNLSYSKDDNFSLSGFIQRLDNHLNGFEESILEVNDRLAQDRRDFEKLQGEASKQFADLPKLEMLRKDANEVLAELRKSQANDEYVSSWTPASLEDAPKSSDKNIPSAIMKSAAPEAVPKDRNTDHQSTSDIHFSATETLLPPTSAPVSRIVAFDALDPTEAIKLYPDLERAYSILEKAKIYAEENFKSVEEQQRFLKLNRDRISEGIRSRAAPEVTDTLSTKEKLSPMVRKSPPEDLER